ncbi:MAG: tetratricopeptide repeat protein [Pseudomonadota bacterium]
MEEFIAEAAKIADEFKIEIGAVIVGLIVAFLSGLPRFIVNQSKRKPEPVEPARASGGAVVAQPGANVAIQSPITFEAHQAALKDRETQIRSDLERAHEAEKDGLRLQLAEAQRRIEAGEADFVETKQDLDKFSTEIAQIENLPPEKLERAQNALAAGRKTEAKELLASVEMEESEGIERAAKAAYLLGEIAEEDIRWADSAAHYTRAANLAPTYDRLKKAREFIWRAGDYAGAVASGEALIATAITEFGDGSEKHASALNEHALTLNNMGRYEEAEPLYRQAIEIDKATIGEGHPDYATHLNNLAGLLRAMGRYEEAEPLYRQVLDILGREHSNYAGGLNNLASLLQAMGRYEEAEPLNRQAIDIGKATIGEGHPEYAVYLNNLAGLLEAIGRYAEAEPLYRQAIDIGKATIGEGHPEYAAYLNNLAGLLEAMGRYAEAEPLYRQAIDIDKATIGEGHPEYAKGLNNLAGLFFVMGRYEEAEPLLRQMITIFRESLGDDHPNTRTVAANYAIFLRAHAPDHPDLAELEATFGPDIGR